MPGFPKVWPRSIASGVAVFVLLCVVAVVRIVATYPVLNNTSDEPAHIATGMEWLDHGTYRYETLHPPMRAVFALGPWLLGQHYHGTRDIWTEGRAILYGNGEGDYWRLLTSARVAALPFFLLALLVIFLWARRLGGVRAAVLASLLYSTLPLALAHAGIATTDVLVTGTWLLALYLWGCWLTNPRYVTAVGCFGAIALAVLSKFTALMFVAAIFSLSAVAWLAAVRAFGGDNGPRGWWPRLRLLAGSVALGTPLFMLLIWAGYRFSMLPVWSIADRPHDKIDWLVGKSGTLHELGNRLVELPLPAAGFFDGLQALLIRNMLETPNYFLGKLSFGTPAFFPVAILVKTPIPFLILMTLGFALLVRWIIQSPRPLATLLPLSTLVILLICMKGALNIGVRHVLPLFPLLAIAAGVAAARLWDWSRTQARLGLAVRSAVVLLLGWQLVAGARIHPDYLAYFNECCAAHPEQWLIDSDLDWGQDLDRLAGELRRRKVQHLHIAYHWTADVDRMGLPPHEKLRAYEPVKGWVAIGLLDLRLGTRDAPFDQYQWLRAYQPVQLVGKSMLLFWIP